MISRVIQGFSDGWKYGRPHAARSKVIREDKKVREDMSESQIDKMLKDSFPASDPPSTY